jgi:hypothetical protein
MVNNNVDGPNSMLTVLGLPIPCNGKGRGCFLNPGETVLVPLGKLPHPDRSSTAAASESAGIFQDGVFKGPESPDQGSSCYFSGVEKHTC